MGMLCDIEIVEYGSGCDYGRVHGMDTEPLEGIGSKLFQKPVHGGIIGENPVVKFEGEVVFREAFFEEFFLSAFHEHLFWREIRKEFLYVVDSAFGHEELTGRYVEKSGSYSLFAKLKCGKKVILAMV